MRPPRARTCSTRCSCREMFIGYVRTWCHPEPDEGIARFVRWWRHSLAPVRGRMTSAGGHSSRHKAHSWALSGPCVLRIPRPRPWHKTGAKGQGFLRVYRVLPDKAPQRPAHRRSARNSWNSWNAQEPAAPPTTGREREGVLGTKPGPPPPSPPHIRGGEALPTKPERPPRRASLPSRGRSLGERRDLLHPLNIGRGQALPTKRNATPEALPSPLEGDPWDNAEPPLPSSQHWARAGACPPIGTPPPTRSAPPREGEGEGGEPRDSAELPPPSSPHWWAGRR
jgi:hypothetical protein